MRPVIILILQVLLLTYVSTQKHIGDRCQSNSDCFSWLACVNNVCSACGKESTLCEKDATGFLSQCCEGTTCEPIHGLNSSLCVRNNNNCATNADCSGGLLCVRRLGKCGLCKPDGVACALPYDTLECCSSYCRLDENNVGTCSHPFANCIPEGPPCRKLGEACDEHAKCCSKWCRQIHRAFDGNCV